MSKEVKNLFYPKSRKEWRDWLIENHKSKEHIWLIFYKKQSQIPSLSWSEAVDEALCFGWIDSVRKSIDDQKFKQYFSKRKVKSNWSKINKEKIEKLIDKGLMSEAGLASIELAKDNGSWTILDNIEALIVPADLQREFELNVDSKEYYLSLSNSKKKGILYWLESAKQEATRQKRMKEIIECSSQKKLPKHFRA